MKTLNIEMNVRHMHAQSILTASIALGETVTTENKDQFVPQAPGRSGNATSVPVRAGF